MSRLSLTDITSSLNVVVLKHCHFPVRTKKKSSGFPLNCPHSHRPLTDTDSIAPVTEVFPATDFVKRILLVVNEKSLCNPSSQQASESLTLRSCVCTSHHAAEEQTRDKFIIQILASPPIGVKQRKYPSNETSPALNEKLV